MIERTEMVPLRDVQPHPQNYREHPDDQLEHIVASIRAHGVYRPVVLARDNTILAGHGVVQALQQLNAETVPVIRLDIDADSDEAIRVLVGDNEVSHLGVRDDRLLTDLLKGVDLMGTGFDDQMLANLAMVTRPASEIADFDAAAEWVGMPEYHSDSPEYVVIIRFESPDDRAMCFRKLDIPAEQEGRRSIWYPPRDTVDRSSVKFE